MLCSLRPTNMIVCFVGVANVLTHSSVPVCRTKNDLRVTSGSISIDLACCVVAESAFGVGNAGCYLVTLFVI